MQKFHLTGCADFWGQLFALGSLALQVYIPFSRYSPFLKVLTLSLFAYVATVFVAKVPWSEALRNTFIPQVRWRADYAVAIVAILGTTISPYLFFWQASQEVEEVNAQDNPRKPLKAAPAQGPDALKRVNFDTSVGMTFSNVVAYFIILTAATVLHAHGKTDIQASADATAALRPIAGNFAFLLFGFGIVGTGLLALPVLAGSTAYAMAEAWGRPTGLEKKPKRAPFFYGVLIVSTLGGAALNFTPVDPIKALFWSAIINGVAAVPAMVVIMLVAQNKKLMGKFVIGGWVKGLGWLATGVIGIAAVVMFATWGR